MGRYSRFYDADLGRFLSVDPLAGQFPGWSPYNYVLGNPVGLTDLTGMAPDGGGGDVQVWSTGQTIDGDPVSRMEDVKIYAVHISKRQKNDGGSYAFLNAAILQYNSGGYFAENPDLKGKGSGLATVHMGLEDLELVLDVIGAFEIPIVSQMADLAAAGVAAIRGDHVAVGLSMMAIIPGAGEGAFAAKMSMRVKKYAGYVDEAVEFAKPVDGLVDDVGGGAGGRAIGLGIDSDLDFHRSTGAVTWKNAGWQRAGLTKVDWGRASMDSYHFKQSFYQAAQNSSRIMFNVTSFDPNFIKKGMTNFEFDHITNSPSLLGKTTFFKNGSTVKWNGSSFE